MSAKWRALQHRHRYTYSAVVFPSSYTDSLKQSSLSLSSPKFFNDLLELISLNSIYAQVNHSKNVAASFRDVLMGANEDGEDESLNLVSEATKFYLEILFFENSLQLHRTLVSPLVKTRKFHHLISSSFRVLCNEYGGLRDRGKRFCVSRVALSVMGMPKLGYLVDIIEACAVLVAWDIVSGLENVISETEAWARPPPTVMEQCQEALSCLYYLLQRFPGRFKDLDGEDATLMERIIIVVVSILRSTAFSRDCFVAAGVSFCVALQVCLSDEELGLFIAEGIFYQTSSSFGSDSNAQLKDVAIKVPFRGDICSQLCTFTSLSRLCLIRGILTAVSRSVLNLYYVALNEGNGTRKTILYDGILPELCNFCENSTDSHFNFHSLTVMQICLQQIKTSMLANLPNQSENYSPITEEMGARLLRIIWNNLEDPLNQAVKQVHLIFDLFLDVQSTIHCSDDCGGINLFLQKIASYLIRLGARCKGRYIPLASVTKRLGAMALLAMSPSLLFETVQAYVDDDVCCAVTSFLKCFLECLRNECWSSEGAEKGYSVYREHSLPPFLHGLASGVSKLRSNMNTYALQVLLELDVDCIFPLLAFVSIGPNGEESILSYPELGEMKIELGLQQKVAILVSLLKVSRVLQLIEGDIEAFNNSAKVPLETGSKNESVDHFAVVCVKGIQLKVPVEWLVLALTHVDESVRVDAAESLFLNPKTASLPSHLELFLMKVAVPLNMRSSSTGFQMKWTSLFRKFFSRVRTALERQYKQGSWQPILNGESSELYICNQIEGNAEGRAENLFKFMKWLSCFLFLSCYPSAPYRRKIMAMELIIIMTNVWSLTPSQDNSDSVSPQSSLYPYKAGITSPDLTLLLVGSIVDSWDRLRENSFQILLHFPNPLPGISSEDMLKKVIAWAKRLVCSPRVRESDAGALTLRLIFKRYVVDLGWIIGVSANVVCSQPDKLHNPKDPVIEYIKSLIDWVDAAVTEGERDLSEACKNSFVHGVLLALRYTFEELDWNSGAVLSCASEMRHVLEKLLELVMRITSLALWVVSADALCLPEDMDEMIEDDNFLSDIPDEIDALQNQDNNNSTTMQDARQSEQIVMVGCWLAMKEVSLLLGTIIRKIPLPSNSSTSALETTDSVSNASDVPTIGVSKPLLDVKQLEKIGDHFMEVLLKMKHNGAIDKTRAGFTALCNRLLCCNDPRLGKLTETWMEQLLERTVAKGQTVDDLLRRSAGIPAAFIALFLSEPEGAPKKLLPQALRWLLDLANKPLSNPSTQTGSDQSNGAIVSTDTKACENLSKIRDEGVVPTVHAFNVLRAAFNDTNLATDTSGFSAEAMIVSIRSFSSAYWEVRNSATLAYTALVRRMTGFLNVQKRESGRRAVTGLEFFHRYPSLHPFIYSELEIATELLNSSGPSESSLANLVHPSLCPILILLSRLKPSAIASESGDDLDPFLFMPFIKKCSTQSNLRVRILASRALSGLVSNEKLPSVVLSIASELPTFGVQHSSSNLLHGDLLQLGSLLDANCRNLADCSKRDEILGVLFNTLLKCTWIASPKMCPCPILNASFLRVLDHMLSTARTCNGSKNLNLIYNLHLELSTVCLDAEASYGLSYYDPTIAELREQAALSYFHCVFQPSEEAAEEFSQTQPLPQLKSGSSIIPQAENSLTGLKERLVRSLSDSSYEVRLASSKWLLRFLKTLNSDDYFKPNVLLSWTKTDLQVTLLKLLEKEKNHRCQNYILRILYYWNLLTFRKSLDQKFTETIYIGALNYDSVLELWGRLTYFYQTTRHPKSRGTVLCCLAMCVKHFANVFKNNKKLGQPMTLESFSYFVDLIKHHSSSSEPVNMRMAAADALVASGLLEQAKLYQNRTGSCFLPQEVLNNYANLILETWLTCIKLLEDEDDGIRQSLATDVQKCFSSKVGAAVPIQVEKVIELSFDHLSSIFSHSIEYFNHLSKWVFTAASYAVPKGGDLIRRVFDKEIDNHHEEKLLICQICCSHLEKLPISSNKDVFMGHLLTWRNKFYEQLVSFARDHISKQGADWIGGVGNHKDAFLPLYGNLLGFYALSNCIFNLASHECDDYKPLMSDVVELGRAIEPFLSNPLLSNIYGTVVGLHKKRGGVAIAGSVGELIWEGFDPYFLLR